MAHWIEGIAYGGAILYAGYTTGHLEASLPLAFVALLAGIKNGATLSQILSAAGGPSTTSSSQNAEIPSVAPSMPPKVAAQITTQPSTTTPIDGILVTSENVGHIHNGDGSLTPCAPLGSVVKTMPNGKYRVTTPQGDVVYSDEDPFSDH